MHARMSPLNDSERRLTAAETTLGHGSWVNRYGWVKSVMGHGSWVMGQVGQVGHGSWAMGHRYGRVKCVMGHGSWVKWVMGHGSWVNRCGWVKLVMGHGSWVDRYGWVKRVMGQFADLIGQMGHGSQLSAVAWGGAVSACCTAGPAGRPRSPHHTRRRSVSFWLHLLEAGSKRRVTQEDVCSLCASFVVL